MNIKYIKNLLAEKFMQAKTKFYETTKALFLSQKKEESDNADDNSSDDNSSDDSSEDNLLEKITPKKEEKEPIEKVPIEKIYDRAWNQALEEILMEYEYDRARQEYVKKKLNKEKENLKNLLETREKEINISAAFDTEKKLIEDLKKEMYDFAQESLEETIERAKKEIQKNKTEHIQEIEQEIEQDFDCI